VREQSKGSFSCFLSGFPEIEYCHLIAIGGGFTYDACLLVCFCREDKLCLQVSVSQINQQKLGRLVATHPPSPATVQRAVFIAVLAFVFFLAMIFVFYLRQNIVYFLLSTAFLIVYLITMFSFIKQRQNVVEVFENGFRYKKQTALWTEITGVAEDGTIEIRDRESVMIPQSVHNFPALLGTFRSRISA
jgi:hypothetical protein